MGRARLPNAEFRLRFRPWAWARVVDAWGIETGYDAQIVLRRTKRGGGEEPSCEEPKQVIAVDRFLSYPSPSFPALIQPSTLHHGDHNLEGLGGVDRNIVQKLGNR